MKTGDEMKTIGVLGGLGPQATMDFEARTHRVAQKLIPQKMMFGYPPMIVSYFRFAPMVLDATNHPVFPLQPNPKLFEAVSRFRGQADFFVVPSNMPHFFQKELEEAAGCPLLSIIETALAEVERRGWRKVGVLGYGEPVVYTEPMKARGIETETLVSDPELMKEIDDAVRGVMEGRMDPKGTAALRAAIDLLRGKKVEAILLGCTELPLILGAYADEAPDLINPAQLLAERAVRYAIA